jgi:hypothetical protein
LSKSETQHYKNLDANPWKEQSCNQSQFCAEPEKDYNVNNAYIIDIVIFIFLVFFELFLMQMPTNINI